MVLVYLNSGDCVEVRDAFRAERRNGSLVCLDVNGEATASFPATDVESFTANVEMAAAMKDEICEELTFMQDGEVIAEEADLA